ncbi:hypothetical protein [Engelhardtia mirabilis]|uniref:DUF1565 domain-containing protein n=1 Tax=Engelhardtia mirabilis TaxID=2528011 RepID=A0A518BGE1_9BACT|nr:hypothetical protein Pla133_11240 [Planctomycetes bacterium Pla133]QDV00385.1 hypothetical protein Pla86_11240 [Planctomycetes bacterium Pla86]
MLPIACLALALAPAPFADHWVGPPGSGHPYQTIQAAVDAAQPGDRVFVESGDYGPVLIDKPLQLSGRGSSQTRILAPAGSIPIEIVGNGSGLLVRLSNFELGTVAGVDASPPAFVRATGVLGPMEFCDLKIVRAEHDAHPTGGAYLDFAGCTRTFLSSVRVVTTAGPAGSDLGGLPLSALRAQSSNVWFSDGRLEASRAPTDAGALEVPGAHAIELIGSKFTLALCDVQAGNRSGPPGALTGGDGLHLVASTLDLHGGKTNRLAGGDADADGPAGQLLAGAALFLDGTSSARWGSDVVFAPGEGPNSATQIAVVAQSGAQTNPRPDRLPSMWIADPTPKVGVDQGVFLEGDPGAIHFWWLALYTGTPIPLPGIEGVLLLDLILIVNHAPIVLNQDGLGSDVASSPADPVLGGLMLSYQSLEYDGVNLQLAPPWFITFSLD